MSDIRDEVSFDVSIAWRIKERQCETIINTKIVSQIDQKSKTTVTFKDARESRITI